MTIVVKLGGSAGIDLGLTLDDLAEMWPGQRVVLIHGANAALDEFTRAQGREPRLVKSASGQVSRFTDQQTMDDFLAIYAGRTNKRIVEGLQARGVNAVGLSGLDGGTARGKRKDTIRVVEDGKPKVLRGDYAGSLTTIDTTLLDLLLGNGFLPVLTPPALSLDGEAINVDGDKLALRLALALKADALVILSNTAGLLADVNDPHSLVQTIDVNDDASVAAALDSAEGRFKKKVLAGVEAVREGIPQVIFGDARIEHPVSRALAGAGTAVVGPARAAAASPTQEHASADRTLQPALYAKRDVVLQRGSGALIWDANGREYVDVMSNYGVNILGHAHPDVTAALSRQAGLLISGHQSFLSDVRGEFLEALVAIAPAGLDRVFLSNSGTEAIEAGLKFARVATGRTRLVAARAGYHGRTIGALAATAEKKYREPFLELLSDVIHVPFNNLDALDGAVDDSVAAIVLEPIQGEGGINLPEPGYLQAAAEIAKRNGALLVLDEIQTGLRTGAWFAAQHEGVSPDILCTAKGLANGVPIGATLLREAISATLGGGVHGSTFGGNPLACAAGLATLRAIEHEGLLAASVAGGERLRAGIAGLESPQVRAVRGRGQMTGVEFRTRVTPILKGLQERGVLALPAGSLVIRFLPPLVITAEQIDRTVAALGETLAAL